MMQCAQACPETYWANYSQDPYPATPDHPGHFPTFLPNASMVDIANHKAAWEWANEMNNDPVTMNQALVQRFLYLLSPTITKEYINWRKRNPNETYTACPQFFVEK